MSATKHNLHSNKKHRANVALLAVLASLFLLSAPEASAQTKVTGITYGNLLTSPATTTGEVEYLGYNRTLSTIYTATQAYSFNGDVADRVYFRRSGSSNNNATVFYDYNTYTSGASGADAVVYGQADSTPTLEEIMKSSNLTQGLRNPFANSSTNDILASNIERIDFFFSGGYTVTGNESLVFFDLENAGNFGDGFRIAAYTSVNANNEPTAYANTGKLVAADSFGDPITPPTLANSTYLRVSTSNGDNLTGTQTIATLDTNAGGQSELYLVGISLTFADLGISVGQTIYGYSLMAGDVSVGTNFNNTSRLVNWTNTNTYLNNTDGAQYGNMDFMSFGAQLANKVPEPSTYGMIFLGLGVAFFGVRRVLKQRTTAAS